MKFTTNDQIRINATILEKMIATDTPYEEIVEQSQKLDKYIVIEMKHINKIRVR